MYTVPKIPGVSLEVYKQHRQIVPEPDGYVGQLFSGFATVLAVIDPNVDSAVPTIGIFRDGQDHYIEVWNWLVDPEQIPAPHVKEQQTKRREFLGKRQFAAGTSVYGVKVPLRVNEDRVQNTVHYPENMLMLAQFCCGVNSNPYLPADCILVWKVALVSQSGEFFLTVQEAYDVRLHQDDRGNVRIPRLAGHKQLERLLIANAPDELQRYPLASFFPPAEHSTDGLHAKEGIVERWYAARNMGCILTKDGPARVHWSDVPPRPRLRYLVAGERVKIATLSAPPRNPRTKWRKVRKARFQLQACGIRLG